MTDKKELYSVAEYAAAKGISKQAVYKQLNNKLQPFVVVVDGQKYINAAAFGDNPPKVEQPIEQHSTESEQPIEQPPTFLQQQITEKDKQIESLLRQIESLQQQNSNLTELLRNSQVLLAAEKKILIEQGTSQEQTEITEEKAKQGFFKRLFGRKKAAE